MYMRAFTPLVKFYKKGVFICLIVVDLDLAEALPF